MCRVLVEQRYEDGPTSCAAAPKVVKNIQKQIKESRALSRGDIRLATAMGMVNADTIRPLGFNDELFYPPVPMAVPTEPSGMALRSAQPMQRVSRSVRAGSMHALALLVDFQDNRGTRSPSDFESLLFDPNNAGSMTSYYRTISGGRLSVTGEVTPYIRAPQPYTFYTNGESGTGSSYPNNTPGLLFDVLTKFCQTDNLARFDNDGDGFVDGVFLIHAGGGAEAEPDPTKRAEMIWSHKWVLPTPFENNGVKVFAYSTEPEDGRVGVFAHEFGHVLGLPDLYDSTYRSKGIGNWCLMSGGSWGGGGNRPTRMSAWCLAQLGWIKPRVVKKAETLTLLPLAQDPKACVRLWTKGKKTSEYFLLENRQKTGQDSALPGSGLAVWHIDESQSSNTNPLAYKVGLVQADGKRDLEFNRNDGDAGDVFPGTKKVKAISDSTNPSTRANNGLPSGVALSAIAESGGSINLKVKV